MGEVAGSENLWALQTERHPVGLDVLKWPKPAVAKAVLTMWASNRDTLRDAVLDLVPSSR